MVSCCWSLCYCCRSWCTNGVGVSVIPFGHAVPGCHAVPGFPAVDGVLAVACVPADPVVLFQLVALYTGLQNETYYTI